MSTTIDSLVIDIQSSSADAVGSIERLAGALEKMKKSTISSTAINNLKSLTQALKGLTPVSSNANKLGSMAESLSKLAKVGSLNGVINQISRLPEAMRGLSDVNLEGIDDKFEKIAMAADKLSQKLGPLSKQMTTIKTGLGGVSKSAKSASSGVSEMGKTVKSVKLSSFIFQLQQMHSTLSWAKQMFAGFMADAIEWEGISARFGRGFGPQAQETYEWIQKLNKEMGINVQQFMQYSSIYATMLSGFGVVQEDASKMALGYTELTYDIWAGYNDIYKNYADAADAVRSAIAGEVEPIRRAGFTIVESTLEQTAKNHGLTISLEKATEAQKSYLRYLTLVDQAHAQNLVGTYAKEMNTAEGVMRTFDQQLKSLKQSFGSLFLPVLVEIMPWLQAFVDLLSEAVHWFAGLFGIKIQKIDPDSWGAGALEGVGDSANNATGAVKDTTKALKEMKNATLGIDELNVISPPSNTSGANGSAGGGASDSGFAGLEVDSLWDESIFDGIQSKVKGIKEEIEKWLPVIGTVSSALAGLGVATLLKHLGEAFDKMNLLQKLFATVATVVIEAALVFTFADNYLESGNLLYLIGEALVTAASGFLLFKAWGPSGAVLALGVSILAQLAAIKMNLADGTIDLSSPELWIQAITSAIMAALGGAIIAKNTSFFAKEGFVIGLATTISLTMVAINTGAIESGAIDSSSFESWIMQAVSVAGAGMTGFTVGKALKGAGGGKAGLLIGVTAGLVVNLASVAGAKGEDFGNNFSDWISAAITSAMTVFTGAKLWQLIGPALKTAIPELGTKVTGWLAGTGATSLFAKIEAGLAAIPVWGWIAAAVVALIAGAVGLATVDYDFTDIGEKVGKAIGFVIKNFSPIGWAISIGKWLYDAVVGAIDWFKEQDIDSFSDFCDVIIEGLTGWMADIDQWYNDFVDWAINVSAGIKEGFKKGWDNLIENLGEFFTGLWDGLCEAFGIASPAKEMEPIGDYIVQGIWEGITGAFDWIVEKIGGWVTDVIDGVSGFFSDAWDTITGWFSGGNKKEEEYTVEVSVPNIDIKKKLSEAWDVAKNWWDKSKAALATYTPSIGNIKDKVSSAWLTAKNWWDKSKAKLAEYTPSIGSIKNKLYSAWVTAKSWWDKSKAKLAAYTPSIGSIKDKLSSAWTTAKNWWNKSKGSMSYTPIIGSIKSKLQSAWNTAKSWWNKNVKLSIPSLSFKVTYSKPSGAIKKGIVKALGLDGWPKLSFAANGGIFDQGSLVWAGERGPEIVANAAGGKTGVMNVAQMQDAVYEGVYAAMAAVMRTSNGGGNAQAVNVYLDGKQIYSSVEQHKKERGANLMGNQVYAY